MCNALPLSSNPQFQASDSLQEIVPGGDARVLNTASEDDLSVDLKDENAAGFGRANLVRRNAFIEEPKEVVFCAARISNDRIAVNLSDGVLQGRFQGQEVTVEAFERGLIEPNADDRNEWHIS